MAMQKLNLLWIGSAIDELAVEFRNRHSVIPVTHHALALPPSGLLMAVEIVWVFGVERIERLQQLRYCCAHQREHGFPGVVFGFSSILDARLAHAITSHGAHFGFMVPADVVTVPPMEDSPR
jgi:hypothetical protein